jgi:hypothetical protein
MDETARSAAIAAILAKRDELLAERARIHDQQEKLSARDREIDRDLADCRAAGRVFGVKVELPVEQKDDGPAWRVMLPGLASDDQFTAVDLFRKARSAAAAEPTKPLKIEGKPAKLPMPRVRDIVLDRLKAAGQKGSKATPIQAYIESTYSTKIHDKTVGMTLYRLARDGLVRRDGHTWFIVPETVNPGGSAPGSSSNP